MSDDTTVNAATLTTLQQALTLHQAGQLAQAQALYDRVLQLQPENFDALHLSGLIAFQSKNPARAVELINRALATSSHDEVPLNPGFISVYVNRGLALAALNQHDSAIASFDHAIRLDPRIAHTHQHRGISLHALGRYTEAASSYRQAIVLDPECAEAHHYLGSSLIQLRQHEAAIASIDQAIALKPGLAEAYVNRALAFHEIRQHQLAKENYRQAIVLQPKLRIAHRNLSHLYLQLGDYENGWEEFEWRLRKDDGEGLQRTFKEPRWFGRESLAGKTVLLHSEQGLGDTIQFCRYVKLVADLGARVILEIQKPLAKLLANLDGVATLVTKGSVLPPFQFHCPLMSLPLAFQTRVGNIPSPAGYLKADAGKIEMWQARLGSSTKPRVGLVWSGNPLQKNNHNRSIPLAVLTGLLDSKFEYVSLQKDVKETDREILAAHPAIRCFELDDLSDTAALCELLDLVISVDTSVAHLTGALGRPVWIPLGFNADWRYLLKRADSPWYASARLYREDRLKGWNEVVANIRADLMRWNDRN